MKPVLLLIPGMFNTAAIWDALLPLLQPEMDVRIAEVLTQDSIVGMAEDAWTQVQDVPPGTVMLVCGFSMGGYVAMELLARHGTHFQGVMMLDTSAQTETPETLLAREKTISALQRNFERTVEGIIPFSLHPDSLADPSRVEGMRRMMHAVGAETAIRQLKAIMSRQDHRERLSQLTQNVLVVCGQQDQVTPPALSRDLASLIPGAELHWLEATGHQTPLEQAPRLAELLKGLASRCTSPQSEPSV